MTVRRHDIVMLLENNTYPEDVRVRSEAESLVRAGHTVRVVAPRGASQSRRELRNGVHIRRFRAVSGRSTKSSMLLEYLTASWALHVAAVRELLRGATVLHLHNPPDILFLPGALARILGRRVVFDHHDLFPELVMTRFGGGPLLAGARLAERATFAVADCVLAANESHAELAQSRGGKSSGVVSVVRNGPLAATIVTSPTSRPGRLTDPHLVYVGAIAPQDGVELLADVLALLRDEHHLADARLTIVGDGPGRPAVERRLRERGVEDRVTITGWVAPERVRALLLDADVCIDPAPPSELNSRSTMIKIAEYLAAGKPVVAFALDETARTVDGAAVLARPGDVDDLAAAVARLADDPERRSALGRRGLERVRGLTWEHSERALVAAYDSL
jgi:glycosyltransferase involved in cell wall biosynthesis